MNHPKQTLIEREHQHNLYDAPLLFTADILTGKVQVELVTTAKVSLFQSSGIVQAHSLTWFTRTLDRMEPSFMVLVPSVLVLQKVQMPAMKRVY